MTDNPDTQPLDPKEIAEKVLNVDDQEVADAAKKLPDAATVRAVLVVLVAFIGATIGKQELAHNEWVDAVVSGYVAVAPLALAWWIRKHHKAA